MYGALQIAPCAREGQYSSLNRYSTLKFLHLPFSLHTAEDITQCMVMSFERDPVWAQQGAH